MKDVNGVTVTVGAPCEVLQNIYSLTGEGWYENNLPTFFTVEEILRCPEVDNTEMAKPVGHKAAIGGRWFRVIVGLDDEKVNDTEREKVYVR